jgi:hypothetical protein
MSLLDQRSPNVRVVACVQFGCACRVGCSAQDVADLGSFRKRMKVRGGSGVASSASSILRRFIGDILRRPVRFQRGNALQLCPCSAVGEYPSSLDRGTWAMILAIGMLENWEDFLSALRCEPCHDSQFIRGQVEVTHSNRHLSILATVARVGSRACGVTPIDSSVRGGYPRLRQQVPSRSSKSHNWSAVGSVLRVLGHYRSCSGSSIGSRKPR